MIRWSTGDSTVMWNVYIPGNWYPPHIVCLALRFNFATPRVGERHLEVRSNGWIVRLPSHTRCMYRVIRMFVTCGSIVKLSLNSRVLAACDRKPHTAFQWDSNYKTPNWHVLHLTILSDSPQSLATINLINCCSNCTYLGEICTTVGNFLLVCK
jgi:hypothetical protein